ncbi:MAG: response regulator [Bdellovibrionota bacterium]
MNNRLLILEDDVRLAASLEKDFNDAGYQVVIADRIEAIRQDMTYTHALVDLRLAGGDFGLEAIAKIKNLSPLVKIIVLSGYGSITTAVESVKRGAIDYITKPTSFAEIEKAFLGARVSETSDFKRRSLSEVEHEYIDFILTKNEGNISQTAKDLGLHRQSLQRKLKKYI